MHDQKHDDACGTMDRENVAKRLHYTAETMRDAVRAMRELWEEELVIHANELEGAAKMVDEWADGMMVPNAQGNKPPSRADD